MAGININLVADALKKHTVIRKDVSKADFARATSTSLDAYAKKVTKIKGSYQVMHSIMSHVVQGFASQWQELGEYAVKEKELKNFHQKVNFGFVPADVLSTFLADWYEEDKKPTDKEIAKKIVEWLLIQVQEDVEILSNIGEYDQAKAHGAFGYSMDGLQQIYYNAVADDNIIDVLLAFERGLPKRFKKKIKTIHTSHNNVERYEVAYFDKYGHYPTYKDSDLVKCPLKSAKRSLVGHDVADDVLYATVDGNLLNLVDVIDNPTTFTDVQVADYKVKLFMEFWKGYDFLINQAVCTANFTDNVRGLGDDAKMRLYYPSELGLPVVP
jgi:hypothetical protein